MLRRALQVVALASCLLAAAAAPALAATLRVAQPSPLLSPNWQRGVALTEWTRDGLGSREAIRSLDAAIRAGADHVALVPTLYVRSASDWRIAADPQKTASDASLRRMIRAARSRGMRVMLKPHIDSRDGRSRTEMAPADLPRWQARYRRIILRYARLAQEERVAMLAVGTELAALDDDDAYWRGLVASVRRVFGGQITYAANWDDLDQTWWDAVDVIGVDAWIPLTASDEPTEDELVNGWALPRAALESVHARWGKRVLLTEIGYGARTAAARQPWAPWGEASNAHQAVAVQAAFRSLGSLPWLAGAYWWDWPATEASRNDFSLRGRPAAGILRRWHAPGTRVTRPATQLPPAPGESPTALAEACRLAAPLVKRLEPCALVLAG